MPTYGGPPTGGRDAIFGGTGVVPPSPNPNGQAWAWGRDPAFAGRPVTPPSPNPGLGAWVPGSGGRDPLAMWNGRLAAPAWPGTQAGGASPYAAQPYSAFRAQAAPWLQQNPAQAQALSPFLAWLRQRIGGG